VRNFLGAVTNLRPEQSGALLWTYGALPMFLWVPLSIFLLHRFDPRTVVCAG
jgi:DHA2 family multidrug resistance protein